MLIKNLCTNVLVGYSTVVLNQNVDETVFDTDKRKKKKINENVAISNVPEPINVQDLDEKFKGKLEILNRITFSFSDPLKIHSLVSWNNKFYTVNIYIVHLMFWSTFSESITSFQKVQFICSCSKNSSSIPSEQVFSF